MHIWNTVHMLLTDVKSTLQIGQCSQRCLTSLDCGFCGMCYRSTCLCAPACQPIGDSCGPVLNFNSALGGRYGGGYSNFGGYGSLAFGGGYRDDGCTGVEAYPGQKCGYGCSCIGGSTCVASVCTCPPNSITHNNICIIQHQPATILPVTTLPLNVRNKLLFKVGHKCYSSQQCTIGAACLRGTCQCGIGWQQEGNFCKFKVNFKFFYTLLYQSF